MNDKLTAVGVEQDEFTLSEMLEWINNSHATIGSHYLSCTRNGKRITDQIALRLRERSEKQRDWVNRPDLDFVRFKGGVVSEVCPKCGRHSPECARPTSCHYDAKTGPISTASAAPSPVCAEPGCESCKGVGKIAYEHGDIPWNECEACNGTGRCQPAADATRSVQKRIAAQKGEAYPFASEPAADAKVCELQGKWLDIANSLYNAREVEQREVSGAACKHFGSWEIANNWMNSAKLSDGRSTLVYDGHEYMYEDCQPKPEPGAEVKRHLMLLGSGQLTVVAASDYDTLQSSLADARRELGEMKGGMDTAYAQAQHELERATKLRNELNRPCKGCGK